MSWITRLHRLLLLPSSTGISRYLTSTSHNIKCWYCHRQLSLPVDTVTFICPCENHVILPPTTTNYFTIMQCTPSFEVDTSVIKKCYHQLQILLHPDKYSQKSTIEQTYAQEHSSLVNKAYTTLINPYTRGLYLLKLNGLTIDERDNTSELLFLERIMGINEELHNNPSQERLQEIYQYNEAALNECIENVTMWFNKGDLLAAKDGLSEMKYYINIKNELLLRLNV